MKRPFASKRPIGPFAQPGGVDGVVLVYTTSDTSSFPRTRQLERMLDNVYQQEDEVVASDPDVDYIGDPRSNTRGVKINTGVTIMSMKQFETVKEVTTRVIDDAGGQYSQIAVAVPNP
jgi:hypothetical protein